MAQWKGQMFCWLVAYSKRKTGFVIERKVRHCQPAFNVHTYNVASLGKNVFAVGQICLNHKEPTNTQVKMGCWEPKCDNSTNLPIEYQYFPQTGRENLA